MTDNDCIIRSTLNAQRSTLNAQRHNYFLKFSALIFKIIISIILSLIILSLFADFYAGLPSNLDDADNVTNFRYPAYASFTQLQEGFSHGKFNNEGYNNFFDYEAGMNIDILLMGSSHMEALQIMPGDDSANILEVLSGKKIYNIAIRGHDFTNCAGHFENAVKKYRPSKFIVLETMSVSFSDEELNQILQHKVSSKNKTFSQENLRAGGLRGFYAKYLRKYIHENFFPIFSMIVVRVKSFFSKDKSAAANPIISSNPILISQVLAKMADTVKKSGIGAKLIIAYHPLVALKDDGSLKILRNSEAVKIFADTCKANGIYFVDLSERFLSEYKKNYTVPNGFFNTSIASGHMNKDGHRMFAEEIYKLMQKIGE